MVELKLAWHLLPDWQLLHLELTESFIGMDVKIDFFPFKSYSLCNEDNVY